MLNQKAYSGIGSRKTPLDILFQMTKVASFLEKHGYVLRSGGADGADKAFEEGVSDLTMKNIYLPWKGFNNNASQLYKITKKAMDLAKEFHPSWEYLSDAAKLLMARNGYQVLGESLHDPVEFIICYTPHGKAEGGTGQALRIAQHYKIPIFNLFYSKCYEHILYCIKSNKIPDKISNKTEEEPQSWILM
jgi:hypothetical protein